MIYTTDKIHTKPHPGLGWHIFHIIITSEDRYWWTLNCTFFFLLCYGNIFGSCSKVFGNLRFSSDIFGTFQYSSEIFGRCSQTFVWPLDNFWINFGNLRKAVGNPGKIVKDEYAYSCIILSIKMVQAKKSYVLLGKECRDFSHKCCVFLSDLKVVDDLYIVPKNVHL